MDGQYRNWAVALLVVGTMVLATGCLEQPREEYRDQAAELFCSEAQRCDNLGAGSIPETYDDCIVEVRARFNRRWPADRCDSGRINAEDYERCMSRAVDFACEGGLLTRLDEYNRCRASNVCTDEPCRLRVFDWCVVE